MKSIVVDTYAKNLRFAVQIVLMCGKKTESADVDKFLHTLLHTHGKLLDHVKTTKEEFLASYKRIHTLSSVPDPFITQMPSNNSAGEHATTTITLPAPWLLQELPKLWRILEQVFLIPWNQYQDVV